MSSNGSSSLNDHHAADNRPDIPPIITTTDFSPSINIVQEDEEEPSPLMSSPPRSPFYEQQHTRSFSEPAHGGLLAAPPSILRSGRTSLDVPYSPSASSWGSDGSTHVPPSPTLSTQSSVHFLPPTTLALRDNDPSGTVAKAAPPAPLRAVQRAPSRIHTRSAW
ncbi:hypothetical protein NM688_g8513 [Phlebia brevispora]|uniref:Uncharacterized protein n=1 Tax=Phlebia brevispora TaxID=194682 RepID=A0ACC1RQJ9_9APHY|nr:hypothetical protein NM688_g8513 [Phlebia brevispora]